jgi:hypothetical protein
VDALVIAIQAMQSEIIVERFGEGQMRRHNALSAVRGCEDLNIELTCAGSNGGPYLAQV